MKSQKQLYYLLLSVSAILLFAHLGKLYVDIMEARNFVSAREMADEGNWIFTTMNGLPRYEKPPLPTWLSAWMGEIFSFGNIGALRFPAALSCFLLVIYFYRIVNFLSNNARLAFISSMVLVTNFLVIYVGRRANWDIYSYSFMVIGIYYFILALKKIKTIPNYLFAGVLFGLSVLSKGPTGPYVLLIPFYIGYIIVFGWPKWKEIRGIALCAAITVLTGFSWYIYIYLADPETFLAIMEKEATARGNRDVKPFTRYLSFPVQTGVWVLYSVIGLIFPMIRKRTDQPKVYMLFFYWTLFSLILLSLIPSKKERYLFPMMVPLAATTGYYLYYLFQNLQLKKWELNLNKIIFTILAVVSLGIAAGVYFLPLSITVYTVLFSIAALAAAVGLLYFVYKKKNFENAFYAVVVLMVATGIFGIPVLDKMLSNNKDIKSLTHIKERIHRENSRLYTYAEYSPEVWFKYQELMPEIKAEDPKTYPKEREFYIAMNTNDPGFRKTLENLGWKLTYIDTFDDNEEAPPSKNYSERKIHYVYKVIK
ncbi:ArnT family glycosyltransferase [Chryseobacterium gossypii]|uniref:ArnT family glycosyltransferase n=1 Tax=Chryseobacterium gossypii TaxID=3231602 RepID=UPI003524B488